MGLRDEHGAAGSVPIAVWILRALVIAARRARLKMDSEGGFLGDERLVALAIASEIERAIAVSRVHFVAVRGASIFGCPKG
jgi:hypothetical protein